MTLISRRRRFCGVSAPVGHACARPCLATNEVERRHRLIVGVDLGPVEATTRTWRAPMVSSIQTGNASQTYIPDRSTDGRTPRWLDRTPFPAPARAPDRRRRPRATRFACRFRPNRDARRFCMNSHGCVVAGIASPSRGRFADNLLCEAPRPKRLAKKREGIERCHTDFTLNWLFICNLRL